MTANIRTGKNGRDDRTGMGQPAGHIDVLTFDIPVDCGCSWSVVRSGPGWGCVSRLKYRNISCRHKHTGRLTVTGRTFGEPLETGIFGAAR